MVRGGDPGKRRVWAERFRRHARSGLSVAEFCEWEGVSIATFYNWRKKLTGDHPKRSLNGSIRNPKSGSGSDVPLDRNSFLPVRVTPSFGATSNGPCGVPESSRIEIRLANGVCIFVPGTDSGSLNAVINVVGRLPTLHDCDGGGLDACEEDIAC
jgi:hypothetical protein